MIEGIDLIGAGAGLVLGTIAGLAYFAGLGLGLGIRLALGAARPVSVFLLSAGVRIAAFLSVGAMVHLQAGPWALGGFGVTFILMRHAAIVRSTPTPANARLP